MLLPRKRAGDLSSESACQIRIVSAIRGDELVTTAVPSSPNIVSSFHSQVANTVRELVPKIELNWIDTTTGYEVDILVAS